MVDYSSLLLRDYDSPNFCGFVLTIDYCAYGTLSKAGYHTQLHCDNKHFLLSSWVHLFLWRLFVSQIVKGYARQGADEKDNIKPAMVEVELQVAQHLGDDHAVLRGHVHAHEQNRRNEIHSHCLSQKQYDDIGRLAAWHRVKELEVKQNRFHNY